MAIKRNRINTTMSRYGDIREIFDCGGGCYIVEGKTKFTRGASDDEGTTLFDFEGGPAFHKGEKFIYDPANPDLVIDTIIPESSGKEGWGRVSIIVE
jgi:hypothetical protein